MIKIFRTFMEAKVLILIVQIYFKKVRKSVSLSLTRILSDPGPLAVWSLGHFTLPFFFFFFIIKMVLNSLLRWSSLSFGSILLSRYLPHTF
ncbi:hypothetical protein CEXT_766201 [Caerostris extrusa]|uniref:Uncharacterized protein n=1 Tax=Caerostris extrusa TaxID=172846 RepID=A0AAV4P3X3_CAEEX|nr:hypothetical protein CEXT_766201 [Caerostris extrusa]